ncbi:MAG: iron-sulfur cluster repair di-iron protein, ric [Clostridiales bacterium]|nr:iron-sulfur cluster repair di-iron protein, ric [Clostridiales bacterium]
MANKQIFNEIKAKHFKILEQYVPVVARVHGKHHPEFLDVLKLFNAMAVKIKEAGREIPALGEEFEKLRDITDSYTVPGDVCESYEAVYNMLSELDQAYQA